MVRTRRDFYKGEAKSIILFTVSYAMRTLPDSVTATFSSSEIADTKDSPTSDEGSAQDSNWSPSISSGSYS